MCDWTRNVLIGVILGYGGRRGAPRRSAAAALKALVSRDRVAAPPAPPCPEPPALRPPRPALQRELLISWCCKMWKLAMPMMHFWRSGVRWFLGFWFLVLLVNLLIGIMPMYFNLMFEHHFTYCKHKHFEMVQVSLPGPIKYSTSAASAQAPE